jgi:lipopolysaccharide biosynthesis protein
MFNENLELNNEEILKNNKRPNIAVIIQMYWVNMWYEFEDYLRNINDDYDLYVTLTFGSFANDVLSETIKKIRNFHKNAIIIIVENKGLDIGGAFMTMKWIIEHNLSYDFYLKMHSKENDKWRKELLDPICGTKELVNVCINLLKTPDIGMVGSKKWLIDKNSPWCLYNNAELIKFYIQKLEYKKYNNR